MAFNGVKLQWMLIIWTILIYYQVSSDQVNSMECLKQCQLYIQNESLKYLEFTEIVNTVSVRTVYFNLYKEEQQLYDVSQNIVYAWIRKSVGEGIFSLPIDYMSTGLSLPSLFTTNATIYFNESTNGCYDIASQDCKKRMIFSALAKFLRLESICAGTNCGTVCRRNFVSGNKFSCCDQNSQTSQVNIEKCLSPRKPEMFALWIRIITILLSISTSGGILVKIFNKYMNKLAK